MPQSQRLTQSRGTPEILHEVLLKAREEIVVAWWRVGWQAYGDDAATHIRWRHSMAVPMRGTAEMYTNCYLRRAWTHWRQGC